MSQIWKIKDNAPVDEDSYILNKIDISFTSGGEKFVGIEMYDEGITFVALRYYRSNGTGIEPANMNYGWSETQYYWPPSNEKYKTLEFDTAPTGELLAWLQKNADKITPSINIEESELLPPNYTINSAIQSNKEILLDKLELVPAQEDFNTASNDSQIHYCVSKSVLFNDPKADGNIVVSTENIDYTGVAPVSIKIGDGTTLFRDLPTLTSGNV